MSLRKLASLSFALTLACSISLPARAELLKNFKTDGSIDVKSFGIDNETDFDGTADDYRSDTRTRILVGGSFDLLDDVHARVLLRKNNRLHGQGGENLNGVQTALSVDNAYVKIDKVFKRVDLTIGRQFYGDSSDLNIYYGVQPDDLLSVTALDIFRADADLAGWATLTAIGGKTVEGTAGPGATAPPAASNVNSDQDLWGLDVNTDKLIPMGNLALAYYTLKTKKASAGLNGTDNNTLNSLSLKAGGDILSGLGYNAQFVQNFGRNNGFNPPAAGTSNSNDGNAYILGLSFGKDITTGHGAMPVRAHGEFGRGSDDYASISAGKRFGKIWGEHNNVGPSSTVGGAGLTNLQVYDLGAGFTCPMTRVGLDLNWYRFIYDTPIVANGSTSAGSELDLILSYKHSENVSFEASAARFFVGSALKNSGGVPTNNVTRLGGDVKIKF